MKNISLSHIDVQKKHKVANVFNAILIRLIQYFTSRNDVQVWQKKDRYGHTYWQAYDPVTESKISLASEAEMRVWIEQRYYK